MKTNEMETIVKTSFNKGFRLNGRIFGACTGINDDWAEITCDGETYVLTTIRHGDRAVTVVNGADIVMMDGQEKTLAELYAIQREIAALMDTNPGR